MDSLQSEGHALGLSSSFTQMGRAHAKVVATIGPASEDIIEELIEAGMSVARMNFSHGTHEDHRRRVQAVREASDKLGLPVGILADISGPKMRMGSFEAAVELEEGERVTLREGAGPFEAGVIPIDVEGVVEQLEVGQRVYLSDGAVELVIEEQVGSDRRAQVRRPGVVNTRKGVHVPDTELDVEVPTEKDRADLLVCRELEVDFIGVSFVANARQIEEVRNLIPEALIVAKIERAIALSNIEEILEASDGIMVARGDLGVEVELEEVPMVQKSLIHMALGAGKFTITATEMLESMVTSSRPTRAEVTDVANAVLDGTDAVMLSAETAVGQNPAEAIASMERIARAVEASQYYQDLPKIGFRTAESNFSNAVALAAAQAADNLGLGKIICFTKSGNTVRLLSRYRPHAEVIAVAPDKRVLSRISILAHARPVQLAQETSLESMLEGASEDLLRRGLVYRGERVVFVAGVPAGVSKTTNMLKLHRIGDPIKLH